MKKKIIEKAGEMMMQMGIRNVTMDDIATEMGMSKKTLYQWFKNKQELVDSISEEHLNKEKDRFLATQAESKNSIHELVLVSHCLRVSMGEMKANVLNDLQKFYPKSWAKYNSFKEDVMLKTIREVIRRGQEEGYFRPEMDADILAVMRIEQVQTFLMNHSYHANQKDLMSIQLQLFDHFIHGLFTPEGLNLYKEYTKEKRKYDETIN